MCAAAKRQTNDGRGEKFLRSQSAQRQHFRQLQLFWLRLAIERFGGRQHQNRDRRDDRNQQRHTDFQRDKTAVRAIRVIARIPQRPSIQILQKQQHRRDAGHDQRAAPRRAPLPRQNNAQPHRDRQNQNVGNREGYRERVVARAQFLEIALPRFRHFQEFIAAANVARLAIRRAADTAHPPHENLSSPR